VIEGGGQGKLRFSSGGNIIIEFIPGGGSSTPSGEDIVSAGDLLVTWDQEKTSTIDNVNWGTLSAGDQAEQTIFISNESKYPCDLSITTTNWNPLVAKEFINVTWANYKDSTKELTDMPLGGKSQEGLVLKLGISPSISGITDYSFDIVINVTTK
jgi:hypothetical protein